MQVTGWPKHKEPRNVAEIIACRDYSHKFTTQNYEFCRDVFNVSCQSLHMLLRGVLRLSIIRITKYFVHDRQLTASET